MSRVTLWMFSCGGGGDVTCVTKNSSKGYPSNHLWTLIDLSPVSCFLFHLASFSASTGSAAEPTDYTYTHRYCVKLAKLWLYGEWISPSVQKDFHPENISWNIVISDLPQRDVLKRDRQTWLRIVEINHRNYKNWILNHYHGNERLRCGSLNTS